MEAAPNHSCGDNVQHVRLPHPPTGARQPRGLVTSKLPSFFPDFTSTMRAANSIARLCASASITKLTTVPTRLKMRIGRRPQRSDHAPSSGEATSCATENDANSSPIVSGEAPNVSA